MCAGSEALPTMVNGGGGGKRARVSVSRNAKQPAALEPSALAREVESFTKANEGDAPSQQFVYELD